jgi:hypothetical protein
MTAKTSKPRIQVCYQIYAGTRPEVAAVKIREKFGDDFAAALKALL